MPIDGIAQLAKVPQSAVGTVKEVERWRLPDTQKCIGTAQKFICYVSALILLFATARETKNFRKIVRQ